MSRSPRVDLSTFRAPTPDRSSAVPGSPRNIRTRPVVAEEVKTVPLFYPHHEGDNFTYVVYDAEDPGRPVVYALVINVPGVDLSEGYPLVDYLRPPLENHHQFISDVYKQRAELSVPSPDYRIAQRTFSLDSFVRDNNLQLVSRATLSNPDGGPLLATVGGATVGGLLGAAAGGY